ncbi:MAG: hemin-degrading HemS [Pseudomonadota bacterium]|jgi:hypothetical protein
MSNPSIDGDRGARARSTPGQATEANSQWVAAWTALIERQPHLRHPEPAALALHIPEAGLMALRCGQDSTRLKGRVADWLSPIAQWGTVALTVRNGLGAATVVCDVRSVSLDGDTLSLRGDQEHLLISCRAAVHGFLYEDRTAPGAMHSLHLYDPAGQVLLRVQLLHEAGARAALPHLLAHADFSASKGWRAGSIGSEAVGGFPGWCAIVSTLNRMEAARRAMVTAVGSCADQPRMRLVLEGKAAALNYAGPVLGTLQAAMPADAPRCVFSARTTTANHAFVCLAPDNVPYLRFHDGESGTVTLWPQTTPELAQAWVDAAVASSR